MLRSLAEGRGGGWMGRGGQESGCSGGGGRGSDEEGRMSRLVPLPACALVECRVTWKRPSSSLPLSETRLLCLSQKRHCPPPDTLPVSRLTLNPENTHSHQLVKTHRWNHTQRYRCALCAVYEHSVSLKQEKWAKIHTNTQNPIIFRMLNYYDYHRKWQLCHQQSQGRTSNMSSRCVVMHCIAQ